MLFQAVPPDAWYPFVCLLLFTVVLGFIPKADIKRLFLEAFIFGFFGDAVFVMTATALHFLLHVRTGPFIFYGSPIWFNLAWSEGVLIFLYFKPPLARRARFLAFALAFSLLSAMMDLSLHRLGLIIYFHWSPWTRLGLTFSGMLVVAYLHERYFAPTGKEGPPR